MARRAGHWDLNRIQATGFTDNVVELMLGKLSRLPVETQVALQQLACLGNAATATLSVVHGGTEAALHAALWKAVRAGLVFRHEGGYRFLHDRVQEAAYALIPAGEQAAEHLRIGRLLAARTAPEAIEEHVFEIVRQLNRGASLLVSGEERERLAELNLLAGKRAKAATAYASALVYFVAGDGTGPEDRWERGHELQLRTGVTSRRMRIPDGRRWRTPRIDFMLSSRAETSSTSLPSPACG